MNKWLIYILLLAACVSCSSRRHTKQNVRPMPVEVLTVDSLVVLPVHTYVGETEEKVQMPLALQMGGRIVSIYARQGQRVRHGAVLLRVDTTQAYNALQAAEATLRQAQDAYERVAPIRDKELISDIQWVEVQTKLSQAQSAAALAREQLSQCELQAPCDGVISRMDVHEGQMLLPGQSAMMLMSEGAMQVRFAVPESDIVRLSVGDSAIVCLPAIEHAQTIGFVTEKSLVPNRLSHTYDVLLTFTLNTQTPVVPGMVAKVMMKKNSRSGFAVPAACVQLTKDGRSLWVVNDGVACRRAVQIDGHCGDAVLVAAGLKKGEQVVVGGYQKLSEKMAVTIDKE